MPLRDIVNVQIRREIPMVTRIGFGTPLFLVEGAALDPARVTSYGNIDAVAEDFADTTAAYKMAAAAFSQEIAPPRVKIGIKLSGETWTEALQACVDFDDDWYGLAIESRLKADILAVAAFIEPRLKIFIGASADAAIKSQASTDDVMAELRNNVYARTALFFHNQAATIFPECAWLGSQLPTDPGSTTWKFKRLNAIPVDSFTFGERDVLTNKGANFYERIAGVPITREGTMAESNVTFIDIIHGIDWLQTRMAERIFARLTTAPKIPYTNAGIAVIESLIRAQLDQAIVRGVIAPEPEYEIFVPDVLETDELDRANRILRDVSFRARLAGAIHKIDINGTVTV